MGKQDVNWLWPAVAVFGLVHLAVFSLEFRWPQTRWKRRVYDCAVVCGYPAEADGSPSRILKTRVERAAELWKTGRVRFLILSGGAVGEGDGWFFVVAGVALGVWNAVALFFMSLFLCCLWCAGMAVWGWRHRISVRRKTVPFLPFVLPAVLWILRG